MKAYRKQLFIHFLAATTGNLFEHYDQALFPLLAPFLAPIFFENIPYLLALILTYAISILGVFSKPIGALVFGYIGDKRGRSKALYTTLMGMAVTTFLIGWIPTFAQVGWIAPILLTLSRLIQNFFAAGETTGGALLILEVCEENKRTFYNSLYEASSILGILLASIGITWLNIKGSIETQWCWLYWIGGTTGCCAFIIRLFVKENKIERHPNWPTFSFLWKSRPLLSVIIITSGFSYANYYMTTSFLNAYLPLVSSITQSEAIQTNTLILFFVHLNFPSVMLCTHKVYKT